MVATKSNMVALGTKAFNFSLKSPLLNEQFSFSRETKGTGFLIAFICNHCPYVINLKDHFPNYFNTLQTKGMKVFAISSNDVEKYPDDSPHKMAEIAKTWKFDFPYLFDEDQKVARLFNAACTPDFFLFNENKELFYRGQYDESRPGNNIRVSGADLSNAVNLMLQGEHPPKIQQPSIGCNIKWKTE